MASTTHSDLINTIPIPSIAEPTRTYSSPATHPDSSTSSTVSSDNELEREGRSKLQRPKLSSRKSSGTNIIPRDHPHVELQDEQFAADDARAMSPRRNSEDVEKLSQETRRSLQANAQTLQSSLAALAERIDSVKQEHDKLENENKFLQDYIGGLTRTMSRNDLTSSKGRK
ncbi:MAG: hypothetical protein M1830_010186 [Pleopsidium flavum]|nr:MAG: hypothetical protein M1830_010186 [Pleopsidium flavum]